ncbi:hypothetical protein OSTOST_17507 [Ostertagia ostertagi]
MKTGKKVPISPKKGSDSENSDGTPWRGSGGSVNMARRSLASGSRPTTPIMSPILNRSSSGSRLGAMQLTSRSGSGSGLFPPRTNVRRTDSANETDQRRKRIRRRTMIYGEHVVLRNWSVVVSTLIEMYMD